jgi:putative tricarboxylic transport membrane protein
MARQGRAAEAIGVARLASVTGGLVGITVAIFALQPLASAALKLGPGELFLVSIIALSLIGGLVGSSPVKGLFAAAVGLLVAAMSASPINGSPRLDFGRLELYDGVPFIACVIGLFAFTEMVFLARRVLSGNLISERVEMPSSRESKHGIAVRNLKALTDGMRTTAQYPATVLRSGVVGLVLGVIPGVGHSVANFVSYGLAKTRSKNGDKFGTGTPEGIIASEGCDNGVAGGAMIPMLALGIPGSATTAILLAALTLHGINPGPEVLSKHGSLAYAVVLAHFQANQHILPLCVLHPQPKLNVNRVPISVIVPLVIVIGSFGAFANRQLFFDLGLAVVCCLVGIAMRLGGYPFVPLLIGLILGGPTESYFLSANQIGQNDPMYFLSSGIDKFLAAVIVLIFLGYARRAWRNRRREASGKVPSRQLVSR